MRILLFGIIILSLFSCTEQNVKRQKTTYVIRTGMPTLEVVVVDSCEYLYGDWSYATVLTHKGNCKYCKEIKQRL